METLDAKLAERYLIREKKVSWLSLGQYSAAAFLFLPQSSSYWLNEQGPGPWRCFVICAPIVIRVATQALLQSYLNIGDSVHKIENLMGLTENRKYGPCAAHSAS